MSQVKEIHCTVTAMLKHADGTGYHKHFKPGMYNLVQFIRILEGVCSCF
jgi:hypothetical protein